tara:strand:+ start:57978 stop:58262 length:285 start_codon:yes stop_codon:yes gene_type:complete
MNVIGWIIKWVCGLALMLTAFIIIIGLGILLWAVIGLNIPGSHPDTPTPQQNSIEYKVDVEVVKPVIAGESKKNSVSNIYNNPKLPTKNNYYKN